MSEHKIRLQWQRSSKDFDYRSYSRDHTVLYGNETAICASSAPEYYGNPECLNPEQAFVASLASCHMLTFLALASKKGFIVDRYRDEAVGILGRNPQGKHAIISVALRPAVTFGGEQIPSREQFDKLHEAAHDNCFIANSIASCVKVEVSGEILKGGSIK